MSGLNSPGNHHGRRSIGSFGSIGTDGAGDLAGRSQHGLWAVLLGDVGAGMGTGGYPGHICVIQLFGCSQ